MAENAPLLFIITGNRGSGKTTFCTRMVEAARSAGWQVAGMLTHPVFEGSLRTALQAEDLRSGEIRPLAVRSDTPTPGSSHWQFDRATLAWGNMVFQAATPCDLLIFDEAGPLEFDYESGWQAGLEAIDSRQYAIAMVVIRAEMLGNALLRWNDANVVEIDTLEDSQLKAQVIADQLF